MNDVSEKDPANLSNEAEEILNQDLETIKSDVKPRFSNMNLNESNASDRNEILSATANEPSEASTSTKLQTRNKNNVTNLYYGSTTTANK